jgi:hypothetical protein
MKILVSPDLPRLHWQIPSLLQLRAGHRDSFTAIQEQKSTYRDVSVIVAIGRSFRRFHPLRESATSAFNLWLLRVRNQFHVDQGEILHTPMRTDLRNFISRQISTLPIL